MERERPADGADELRADVRGGVAAPEVAGERERERHRGVDVRARKVTGRVDHHGDDQPEHEADPDRAERAVVLGVGDDRAAAREHQRERRDAFRRRPARQSAIEPSMARHAIT